MLSTTLAMTPIYPLRLASRDKTDRPAKAATFELLDRAAHDWILRTSFKSRSQSRHKAVCWTGESKGVKQAGSLFSSLRFWLPLCLIQALAATVVSSAVFFGTRLW
jgi:hypothetical protein